MADVPGDDALPPTKEDAAASRAKTRAEAEKLRAEARQIDADTAEKALSNKKEEAAQKAPKPPEKPPEKKLPAYATKPLEGTIGVGEGVGLVADLLAHSFVDVAAKRIVGRLIEEEEAAIGESSRVLLVTDRSLVSGDWPYFSVRLGLVTATDQMSAHQSALEDVVSTELAAEDLADLVTIEGLEAVGDAEAEGEGEGEGAAEGEEAADAEVLGVVEGGGAGGPVAGMVGPLIDAATGLESIEGVVGAVADIAGLLMPNYSITSRPVTIGETPIVSAVADRIRKEVNLVGVDDFTTLRATPLFEKYAGALKLRNELATTIVETQNGRVAALTKAREDLAAELTGVTSAMSDLAGRNELGESLDTLWEPGPKHRDLWNKHVELLNRFKDLQETCGSDWAKLLPERRKELTAAISTIDLSLAKVTPLLEMAQKTLEEFEKYILSVTTPLADGEYPPILAALLRERLHAGPNPWTHVLYVNLEGSAGEVITKQSRILSPKLRYIGGTHVSFLLLDVATGGTERAGSFPLLGTVKFKMSTGVTAPPEIVSFDKADYMAKYGFIPR